MVTSTTIPPNTIQLKYPRYSRRVQSKSEPSHASQESDNEVVAIPVLGKVSEESPSPGDFRSGTSNQCLQHTPIINGQRHTSAPASKSIIGGASISHIPKPAIPKVSVNHLTPAHMPAHLEPDIGRPEVNSQSQHKQDNSGVIKMMSQENVLKIQPTNNNAKLEVAANKGDHVVGDENQPSTPTTRQALSRTNRGWKRGRGYWPRGRRGRGTNRGLPTSTA